MNEELTTANWTITMLSTRFDFDNIETILFFGVLFGACLGVIEASFLSIYHEEPTRLLVASGMLEQGEWFVPHILGDPYLSKPPGFNWAVALFSMITGDVTAISGRFVSIVSWFLLGGLVGHLVQDWKRPLARGVAVASTVFCLTLFIEKIALAEIDLFFSMVLFLSVFSAIVGDEKGRKTTGIILAHLFFGFALLTKGPVAYLFFYPPVIAYFISKRDSFPWISIVVGGFLSHAIAGAWVWLVIQQISWEVARDTWFSETVGRSSASEWLDYVKQLILFPIIIFFAFLPGSAILLDQGVRRGWSDLSETIRKHQLLFTASISIFIPFLFFWLFPVDSLRYLLPVVPWLGLLAGGLIETAFSENRSPDLGQIINCGAVLLILMLCLPFIIETQWELMPVWTLWIGAVLLALAGLGLLTRSYWSGPTTKNDFVALLSFFLVIKLGFLLVYIPHEKPEWLTTKHRLRHYAGAILKETSTSSLIFASEDGLEIPFYLKQQGISVRKDPTTPPAELVPVITREDNLNGWVRKLHIRLPEGKTFYFHTPYEP